jgi:hypothetical protein
LHPGPIDVLPAQDDGGRTVQALSVFYQSRKRRGPCTLCALVGGAINSPDGLRYLVIRHLDDPIGAAPNYIERRQSGTRTAMPSAKVSAEASGQVNRVRYPGSPVVTLRFAGLKERLAQEPRSIDSGFFTYDAINQRSAARATRFKALGVYYTLNAKLVPYADSSAWMMARRVLTGNALNSASISSCDGRRSKCPQFSLVAIEE